MTRILDIPLSSFRFPFGTHPSLIRDRLGDPKDRAPNYDERFDFSTFFYDCYHDPETGSVTLQCPSLWNFELLLPDVVWTLDGASTSIAEIRPTFRGNAIRFEPSPRPERLAFQHPLFEGEVVVNGDDLAAFEGRNAIFTISKNNRISWVKDWLAYYVAEHGANALVLYDNGSTDYSVEELGAGISEVEGIEVAAIVRADFPFGPGGKGRTNFDSKFLHMTMVELGRRRFLARARAVLNVDIDEFVYSRSGQNIFDATAAHHQGYVRMAGAWVHAGAVEGEIRHADHRFSRKGRDPGTSAKWCVVPDGPLKSYYWRTHRIISRQDPVSEDFAFWHFRQISNGWDYARDGLDPAELEENPRLISTLNRLFG